MREMQTASGKVLDQINKRLTLNLLVQGAAAHTFLTAHHLVKDELNEINPQLIDLYDKIGVCTCLAPWYGELALLCGRPDRFWKEIKRPDHVFARHPLLVRHGAELAQAAKNHLLERARKKGVARMPIVLTAQICALFFNTAFKEVNDSARLVSLAKRVTSTIWGIDELRLHGELTDQVEFGDLRAPLTRAGRMLRWMAGGYGGVVRHGSRFTVVAKAVNWPILSHELVKGTAELVCLHGLNRLEPVAYDRVIGIADQIEYETWLLQAGSELWRRLMAVLPPGRTLPVHLMNIARLDPRPLDHLMHAVIEEPDWARQLIAGL